MNGRKILIMAALALLALPLASAHAGWRGGVWVGGGPYYRYGYYRPYYAPGVVVVGVAPPVYYVPAPVPVYAAPPVAIVPPPPPVTRASPPALPPEPVPAPVPIPR